MRRHSRSVALTLPYIEANPLVMRSLVITDHDGSDADHIVGLTGLPEPSYVALNPRTRAGHIVYALRSPVCLTDAARRPPVNLLARIEHGLVEVLGGDVAYSGRITKNPHHVQDHLALWGSTQALYGLKDLASALADLGALPSAGHPRRNTSSSAVGRNVALFDMVRRWSYRRRGDHTHPNTWERAVFAHAWQTNETIIANDFTTGPLTAQEVAHVSRSIARWTWRKMLRTFSEEQALRGQRGGHATAAAGGRERAIAMLKGLTIDRASVLEVATGGR
ncbi:replication initiation protein [Sanguibacter antarcticus]|nr:replication initiation protein [Sanguibacter antarcticus]